MTIYPTGKTDYGRLLVGGIWTAYHQDGLPIEMSIDICQQQNMCIDWAEAFCDAATSSNLPALIKIISNIIPAYELDVIKTMFMSLIKHKSPESILADKKSNNPISHA